MQEDNNTQTPLDIDLLIDKAADGDTDAFGRLYDMYVDRIYRHICYRVGNITDAEDLTQQVFLKAWKAIHRYKKTASPFPAWLITISHNLIVDFYRSSKSVAYLDLDIFTSNPSSNPDRIAESQFEQEQLRQAILELPGDQQRVVLMRFIDGFSFSEIAASISKSEGAVRVILHRALVRLRIILEKVKQ